MNDYPPYDEFLTFAEGLADISRQLLSKAFVSRPSIQIKDDNSYVTQFDNSVVEDAGLLKMDFLGLKTLTIIKDTVKLIKYKYQKILIPEEFPLDDKKTYELFQKGETVGIFQYESLGMQKYLKDLKPTNFNDLIAKS